MKNKNLYQSFKNAFHGVIYAFVNERNMKIHIAAAVFVIFLSLLFELNTVELLIIGLTVSFVIMAELMNTAIEAAVDLASKKEINPLAKIAKDAASGAVLISALNSLAVGYLVFFKKLTAAPMEDFIVNILAISPVYFIFASIFLVLFIGICLKYYTNAENILRGGMPSIHSAIAFCIATCIFFTARNGVIVALGYFLAFLVAQSRVEGKIHSILQVVLGGMLGLFATAALFQILYNGGIYG